MAYPGQTGADLSQVPEAYRQALIDAANRYNVPIQLLISQGLMETNWGRDPRSNWGISTGGIFQYSQDEQNTLNRVWGTNYDRQNPLHAIEMAAHRMSDFARNEGAGHVTTTGPALTNGATATYDPNAWFMQRNRDNPIWEIGLGSHIGGMTGYLDMLAGWESAGARNIGPNVANYIVRGMAGQTPWDELSSNIRQRFDDRVGIENRPLQGFTGGGIGSDARYEQDLINRLAPGPGGVLGQPLPWQQAGQITPEIGHYLQTLGLMPNSLQQDAGTDFTNTTWSAVPGMQPGWWGPWGAEAVHNWAQEGVTHGYGDPIMGLLGNLNYNLADPGIAAGPGNAPLGGAALAATGGVDLAHWIAQQWGQGWGTRGVDPGLEIWDATPGVHVLGRPFSDSPNVWDASGVQPSWQGNNDLMFWDVTRPGVHVIDQPSGTAAPPTPGQPDIHVWGGDVTNWVPADPSSTWGTPGGVSPYAGWQAGQQDMFFNPNTNNWGTGTGGGIGSWSPTSGYQGPSGFAAVAPGGTGPVDYQHYFDTAGINPTTTFGGGDGSSNSTMGSSQYNLNPTGFYIPPNLGQQIDTTAAQNAAFYAAQVAAFNQQQGLQNMQNLGPVWTGGGITTYMNPTPGGPNIFNYG